MSINTKMVYSGEVKKKMRMSGSEVEIIMARQELTKMSMAEKDRDKQKSPLHCIEQQKPCTSDRWPHSQGSWR